MVREKSQSKVEKPKPAENKDASSGLAQALPIGLVLGVALGAALDNMGVGIAIGFVLSVALMPAFASATKKNNNSGEKGNE